MKSTFYLIFCASVSIGCTLILNIISGSLALNVTGYDGKFVSLVVSLTIEFRTGHSSILKGYIQIKLECCEEPKKKRCQTWADLRTTFRGGGVSLM